jgi:anti-sigma B factor antagonist
MMPKPIEQRLSISMQTVNSHQPTWDQPAPPVPFGVREESKLKLSLEVRNQGDVIIVHCQGRIVYREEAASLSSVVGDVLQSGSKVILDLSGVSSIDSAGIGELALLQTWARERNAVLKLAGVNGMVGGLLELTNLDSVLDIHPTPAAALGSFEQEPACAEC